MKATATHVGDWKRWSGITLLGVSALLVGSDALAQQSQARGIVGGVKAAVEARENEALPDAETIDEAPAEPADDTGSVSFEALRDGATETTVKGKGKLRIRGLAAPAEPVDEGEGDEPVTLDDTSGEFDEKASSDAAPGDVPELHTVKTGDTLYTLCQKYYADPYKWPQLWALNPLITNPHWIFPGDVVRLRATEGDAPVATVPMDDEPDVVGPSIARTQTGGGTGGAMDLVRVGFLSDKDFRAAGKITGSREEKIMLATDDQVYVGFPKDQPMKAGERYTVFTVDTEQPIKDRSGDKVLGYLVHIDGDLVVEQVADERSGRGVLLDVTRVIERDQFISAQVKRFARVTPKPSEVNVEAQVIASFTPVNLLATENYVILSRGSKAGLQVGNRSFVIRRGDGYAPILEGWEAFDPRFPKEVVAELLVVDVHEDSSVAYVARTTKELRVGETTETRKGY